MATLWVFHHVYLLTLKGCTSSIRNMGPGLASSQLNINGSERHNMAVYLTSYMIHSRVLLI